MSTGQQPRFWRRWPDGLRWSACFVLVLGLHATAAAALIGHWRAEDEPVTQGPVILIDLAPVEAAPAKPPNDVTPAPKPSKPEPKPEKAERIKKPDKPKMSVKLDKPVVPDKPKPAVTPDLKPPPEPPVEKAARAPVLLPPRPETHTVVKNVAMPPPRPVKQIREHKRRQRLAKLTPEPSRTKRRAAHATAPRAGARTHNPNAVPRWKTALMLRLQRYKRYPVAARARGVQGVARLAFSVDRSGRVHHARIARSSGSSLLDRATIQLIERAQPLPPPPTEIHGAQIPIVVPIRYNLR